MAAVFIFGCLCRILLDFQMIIYFLPVNIIVFRGGWRLNEVDFDWGLSSIPNSFCIFSSWLRQYLLRSVF